ncbi:MAG: hypothetical protein JWL76_849 [Thermoleophilia bacterium]|nr:hypothetical protein [Thermoleophilia bacterium]
MKRPARTRSRTLAVAAVVVALGAPVTALATVAPEGGGTSVEPGAVETDADTQPVDPPTAEATDEARQVRGELRALARAWDEGGGRFGYPFWEKAGQRWATRQITTTMYREYVTGYRDRLRAGCDLLDSAEIDTSEAKDVRSLALDACNTRVDALRDQQRWLDELIRRDGSEGDAESDATAIDERIAEREQAWQDALQQSYRDARTAMDLAQRDLDESGLKRLPENAFL